MKTWIACGFLLLVGLYSTTPGFAQESVFDGFMLIGNNIGLATMTEDEAMNAIQGKKSVWANGKPILVVLPNTRNAGSAVISRRFFSTNPQGMHRYWLSQVFQGRTNAPVFLENWDDIVYKVREVEGALALVPRGTPVPSSLVIPIR
jgi:hypothetical protein